MRSRFSALLMLLLFVGGGPGISGLDTVLFHLNHSRDIPRDHVEDAGARCHAETCLVTFAVAEGRLLPAPAAGSRLHLAAETTVPVVDRSAPTVFTPLVTTLPRSPPPVTR